MTDLDELRRTLAQQALLAPDGAGVVEAARRGSRRLGRRRTVVRGVLAALSVAAVALTGTAVVVGLGGGGGGGKVVNDVPVTPTPTAPPYRDTAQLTVEVVSDGPWSALYYALNGTTQYVAARGQGVADILVHDPGTYDPTELQHGQRMAVQGHYAFLVPALDVGFGGSAAAIGWRDGSGAWVVVAGRLNTTIAAIAALAEQVRLTSPHDLRAPFALTYLPAGMSLRHAYARMGDLAEGDVMAFLGPTAVATVSDPYWYDQTGFALSIRALTRSDYLDGHRADLGPATKIAGLDTWDLTESRHGWIVQPGSRLIVVETARCQIHILAVNSVPSDDLKRMVEGATFGSCTDRSSWVRPVP